MAHYLSGISDERYAESLFMFPWFAFVSLLISWQTPMTLQLPGSANGTSIIHPVQLQPRNTHAGTRIRIQTFLLRISLKHTCVHSFHSPLNQGLTPRCQRHESLYLFMGDSKNQKRGGTWVLFKRLLCHSRTEWLHSLKGRWQVLFRLQLRHPLPLC